MRLLLIGGGVAGIIALAASMSASGIDSGDLAYKVPSAVILLLMIARLAGSTRPLGLMARQLSVFLAAGVVLMAGYSYRNDFGGIWGRMLGNIVPSHGAEIAPGIMRFKMDDRGQFAIDATVNGVAVRFTLDTGASGIVLSQRDAGRLGFAPKDLNFDGLASTANGTTRTARIRLASLKIGPLSAVGVKAWVNEGELDQSLLGMSYLSTLGRVEIRGDTLILEEAPR